MWTFRAMNTEVSVAAPGLTDDAERMLALETARLFFATERRYSRFRPDSEVSQLNRADGPHAVSDDLLALLLRARAHAQATAGVFEPAVGAAMAAAGYDRSFEPNALDHDAPPALATPARIDQLDIDVTHRRVTRPPHVQVDLGGFLKGLTVDRAAAHAPEVAMIDAGGDVALRGAPDGDTGWTVDIEDPRDASRTLGAVVVRDEAVATSAANRRRWRRGTQPMHHLIDPRTQSPARTDVAQATVIAPTVEEADVMAKVAFILGAQEAARALERAGMRAVLVGHDGAIHTVGDVELRHA